MAESAGETDGVKMATISAVVLARNEENDFFRACIMKLLKLVDEIIVVLDNRTYDDTIRLLQSFKDDRIRIFSYGWQGPESYTSAKNYGISKATKEWILEIDADEVVADGIDLKAEIEKQPDADCFDLFSEHCLWNFGYRDATYCPHVHQCRLHKNSPEIRYPENTMHGLVQGWKRRAVLCNKIVIFHYGYCKNMQAILNRYAQNMKRKEMHTEPYLEWWKNAHYFGIMPAQAINPQRHPSEIKELFKI